MNNPKYSLPKAIIFDWDNTLVDTWPVIASAMNLTRAYYNMPAWNLLEIKQNATLSSHNSFRSIFKEKADEALTLYYKYHKEQHLEFLPLYDGVVELLQLISQLNIPALLVSNKKGDILRHEVAHLKLDSMFFSIVGSRDAAQDKPAPDPVEKALDGTKIDPRSSDVWFIGDSVTDMECAYNSFCRPIFFNSSLDYEKVAKSLAYLNKEKLLVVERHGEIMKMLKNE